LFSLAGHGIKEYLLMLAEVENPLEALQRMCKFGKTVTLRHDQAQRKDEMKNVMVLNNVLPNWMFEEKEAGEVTGPMRTVFNAVTHPRIPACMDELAGHAQIDTVSTRLMRVMENKPGEVIHQLEGSGPQQFISFMASGRWRRILDVPTEQMNAAVRCVIPGAKANQRVDEKGVEPIKPTTVDGNVAVYEFGDRGRVYTYKPVFDQIADQINLSGAVGEDGKNLLELLTARRNAGDTDLDIFPIGNDLPLHAQWLSEDTDNRDELVNSYLASFRRHLITTRFRVEASGPEMIHPKIGGDEAAHFHVTKTSWDLAVKLTDAFGPDNAPMFRPVMFVELPDTEYKMYGRPRFGSLKMFYMEFADGRRVLEQYPNVPCSPAYLRNVVEHSGRPIDDIAQDTVAVPLNFLGTAHRLNIRLFSDAHLGNDQLAYDTGRVLFVSDLDDARYIPGVKPRLKPHEIERGMLEDYRILRGCYADPLRMVFEEAGLPAGRFQEIVAGAEDIYQAALQA